MFMCVEKKAKEGIWERKQAELSRKANWITPRLLEIIPQSSHRFSPQMFSCVGRCPTQIPLPALPPQGSVCKKHLSNIVKNSHNPRQQHLAASAISHSGEEEWSDEKQGEEEFDSCISIFRFPPLLKEGGEIYIRFVFSDCVCQQRQDWCEMTFN